MRLICVSLLTPALIAATAGTASARVARVDGGVGVQLEDGRGLVKIRKRGAFLGRIDVGRVWATNAVHVSGYTGKRRIGPNLVRYRRKAGARGDFMGIWVANDVKWHIKMRGRGIWGGGPSIRGCLVLDGVDHGETGEWHVGSRSGEWPQARTRYRLGKGTC